MRRMLINVTEELRVAIIEGTRLVDLDIEHPGEELKKDNIYKGKISSIEPSLNAVFVDYGCERHGFLPISEISKEYFLSHVDNFDDIDINKVLKLGQELVVQVEKEERGNKGAALTTFISLAGSYLVLMPNNPRGGGISRRIEGDEREQLKANLDKLNVPEGMSIIVRTAGVCKTVKDLEWDLSMLLQYWEAIKQATIAKPGPYLIHQESDALIRAIRDYLRQDIEEIIIDNEQAFEAALKHVRRIRPDFTAIKYYGDRLPLFSRFQIEQQIESAFQREVRLPSGGSIVFDTGEALVSIDINSARATKGGNIEETAYNTNLEAADEIARQLRIRDIGGLVVIDFIDMTPPQHQRDVENRLRDALRADRARIQISKISKFGLLEMSRQRLRSSLSRSTQVPCPRCAGRGSVRSVESLAQSILHLIQESATSSNEASLQVQLPISIATYLLNEKRGALKEIEAHSPMQIVIVPNPHLESPHYQIKEVKDTHSKMTPSYKLPQIPKVDTSIKKLASQNKPQEPMINEFLKSSDQSPKQKPSGSGLMKRLWDLMFSDSAEETRTKQKQQPNKRKPGQRNSKPANKQSRKPANNKKPGTKTKPGTKQGNQNTKKPSNARRGNRGGNKKNTQTNKPRNPASANTATDRENVSENTKNDMKDISKTASINATQPQPSVSTPSSPVSTNTTEKKPISNNTQKEMKPIAKEISSETSKPTVPVSKEPKTAAQPKADQHKKTETSTPIKTPADYLSPSAKKIDDMQQVKTKKPKPPKKSENQKTEDASVKE